MIPLILWSIFQPALNANAMFIQETMKTNLYEIQKKAAIQGKYTEDLYAEFKKGLAEQHGYNTECIQVVGTETNVERGGTLEVEVIIPKPPMNVFDVIDMGSCSRPDSYTPYKITETILSEYIP